MGCYTVCIEVPLCSRHKLIIFPLCSMIQCALQFWNLVLIWEIVIKLSRANVRKWSTNFPILLTVVWEGCCLHNYIFVVWKICSISFGISEFLDRWTSVNSLYQIILTVRTYMVVYGMYMHNHVYMHAMLHPQYFTWRTYSTCCLYIYPILLDTLWTCT